MKFSISWLKHWLAIPLTPQQLANRLTMAGLEVDGLLPVAKNFSDVVVAQVVKVEPHPNGDKLKVCQVQLASAQQPVTIVCGADNVQAGIKVPCAMVGAQIEQQAIKTVCLRGVTSSGMLCSAAELGLAERSEGLLILPQDAPLGEDIRVYLDLDDSIIDIDLTPNRGDCLGLQGIAREVSALIHSPLQPIAITEPATTISDSLTIKLSAAEHCPRYLGRVIRGINPQASTPVWMTERLRRGGIRTIDPVVDVTNYVMLELGQPLHCFDLAKIKGGIEVRLAQPKEELTLLDGHTLTLTEDTLVIADQQQALAIAGMMGGQSSAVNPDSHDLFLESAFFTPISIAGKSRHYQLHTDASYRYERGVDWQLPAQAMARASELLVTIVGGELGPVVEALDNQYLPSSSSIALRYERIKRVLGIWVKAAEVEDILIGLGMALAPTQEGWSVTVPSYRFDIQQEIDLIEEIARIHGYDNLPGTYPQANLAQVSQRESQLSNSQLRHYLANQGYREVITYSFIEPALQQRFDPQHKPLALSNPIAADLSVMRTSLWPSLVKTLLYNQRRQHKGVKIFELGTTFLSKGEGLDNLQQTNRIAGLTWGHHYPPNWANEQRPVDFFDIKGELEGLLALGGQTSGYDFTASEHAALHPGQSAAIMQDGTTVGYLGQLHPAITNELAITGNVYLFELDLVTLSQGTLPNFQSLSKFPSLQRDLAILVDRSVPADKIIHTCRQIAGEWAKLIYLFDLYQGEAIDPQRKSLAISLTLQHPSDTLKEEQVNELMAKLVYSLEQRFNAELRS
jgi:phenylalanyl-tRNA synthetase beta chain